MGEKIATVILIAVITMIILGMAGAARFEIRCKSAGGVLVNRGHDCWKEGNYIRP